MTEARKPGPEVEELFAEFLAQREGDQSKRFDHWVKQHPECEQDLRRLYEGFERLGAHIRGADRADSIFYRPSGVQLHLQQGRPSWQRFRYGAHRSRGRLSR